VEPLKILLFGIQQKVVSLIGFGDGCNIYFLGIAGLRMPDGRKGNMKANKLGWVTSMTVNQNTSGLFSAELEIVADGNPAHLMNEVRGWFNNGIGGASYQSEYMCLYCASPNSIENTHCSKCGAPRTFVIG